MESIVLLKTKVKTLAEEAKIIRREEQRQKFGGAKTDIIDETGTKRLENNREYIARRRALFDKLCQIYGRPKAKVYMQRAQNTVVTLANYRRHTVRKEARATFLAYGYLRGFLYHEIETPSYVTTLYGETKRINTPDIDSVAAIILPHAGKKTLDHLKEDIEDWINFSLKQIPEKVA